MTEKEDPYLAERLKDWVHGPDGGIHVFHLISCDVLPTAQGVVMILLRYARDSAHLKAITSGKELPDKFQFSANPSPSRELVREVWRAADHVEGKHRVLN